MANTQGVCNSFKLEILTGTHVLGSDTIKVALYATSATMDQSTTVYTTAGETPNSGGYVAGGQVVSASAPSLATGTAIWTPTANFVWTSATFTAVDACLLYNSSKTNKAISVHTFGSTTIVAGTLTLTMPTNAATTALIRIA